MHPPGAPLPYRFADPDGVSAQNDGNEATRGDADLFAP